MGVTSVDDHRLVPGRAAAGRRGHGAPAASATIRPLVRRARIRAVPTDPDLRP